jgi:cytochrome b561
MRPVAVSQAYSRPAIFLHWIIAALVVLAYTAMLVRGPKGTDARVMWNTVHYCAGALVLTLAVLRVLWRLWRGAPAEIETARALTFLARLAHLALYVFIFAQPLLGLLMLNSSGYPLVLPGLGLQIQLVTKDPLARKVIHDVHIFIGNAFYWIIGIHALAAIFHHLILKDDTLRRMIGRTATRRAQTGISE